MAKKNQFLAQREAENKFCLDVGVRLGRQQLLDMMCLVLNDPEVMGKDTFGKKRLYKIILATGDRIDEYNDAWQKTDEADYKRAKLDEALAKIFGPELHESFEKRYEFCPTYDYNKGKWKR
jgi:predicted secreted acid phosphatase